MANPFDDEAFRRPFVLPPFNFPGITPAASGSPGQNFFDPEGKFSQPAPVIAPPPTDVQQTVAALQPGNLSKPTAHVIQEPTPSQHSIDNAMNIHGGVWPLIQTGQPIPDAMWSQVLDYAREMDRGGMGFGGMAPQAPGPLNTPPPSLGPPDVGVPPIMPSGGGFIG